MLQERIDIHMIQKRYEEITTLPCETHFVLRRDATDSFLVKSRVIYDHELVYVFGGNGVFTIEGREYPAVPGKLFYFYPGLVHQCETRGPDHVQFYAVHFSFHYGDGNTDCRLPLQPVSTLTDESGILFIPAEHSFFPRTVTEIWKLSWMLL